MARSDGIESRQWQDVHAVREWGTWPETALVRWVARTYGHLPRDERRKVRFVDIGAGSGASTRFLASEGYSVVAIDVAPAALERIGDWLADNPISGHVDLICGDVRAMDIAANMFNCVVDICTLQHVPEHRMVLGRAYSWLVKDGTIFSMWATHFHDEKRAEEYAPCRRLRLDEAYEVFAPPFKDVRVEQARFTDGNAVVAHWLIEGRHR